MPFTPIVKTLPDSQRRAWRHLGAAKDLGFCLYGGTALALRYGHRESVDFDFFSSEPLNKGLLLQTLPVLSGGIVIDESPNTYAALLVPPGAKREIKVSFFGGLGFGRVGSPELTSDGVLLVASVRDLMATKLKVIFDRVEPKDYVDNAEMLSRGLDLANGIRDAMALFPSLNPILCLKTLCYFDVAGLRSLDRGCRQILASAVGKVFDAEQAFSPSQKISSELSLPNAELAAETKKIQEALAANTPVTPRRRARRKPEAHTPGQGR